jgi:MerR family transcriptional regulator, copper efflux regulator
MLINELEKKTGLTRHAIRFYERQGFLGEQTIRREENNYRDYAEETVDYLMMLKAGQAAGFTLTELKDLISAEEANELSSERKVELMRKKMQEIERKKAELDQIQAYLAYKLALIDPEASGALPEIPGGSFSAVWNICLAHLKKDSQ